VTGVQTCALPIYTVVIRLDFAGERHKYSKIPIDDLKHLGSFATQLMNKGVIPRQNYEDFEKERKTAYEELNDTSININQSSNVTTEELRNARKRTLLTSAFHELMNSFKANHLVILLNTCERLLESINEGVQAWLFDDILLPLHENMHQKHKICHVVTMSTFPLPLQLQNSHDHKKSVLEPLDEKSVKQYLQRIGVDDPEVRNQFYEMTHGHAKCVSIVCETWREWEVKGKQISGVDTLIQFQKRFTEKADKEFVKLHILDKLPSPLRNLTQYGSLLQKFNRSLLEKVFSDFLPAPSASQPLIWFDQFINFAYIEELESYNYKMHDLLRRVLSYSIQINHPDQWRKYHERAMDLFQPDIDPIWHYHSLAFHFVTFANGGGDSYTWNEDAGMRYWLDKMRGKDENLPDPLLDAACDVTLTFTSVAQVAKKHKIRKKENNINATR